MRGRSIISVLPIILKHQLKQERLQKVSYEQLRAIAHSTANTGHGSYYDISYDALMTIEQPDDKPAEEIVNDIVARAGLEVI